MSLLVVANVGGALHEGIGVLAAQAVAIENASAPGVVSGVFAPGEGAGGAVDVRTGRYSLEVPLLATAGRGETGFGLVLSYDQELSGLGVDRQGLGAGMGLGLPFVDTGEGPDGPHR
ncbi:hypothetical protein, partial [Streptomyces sp. NRRL F-2664]|uniref:hypothetical protein n=1 Tax=Streptomyces sp. NRRL F-2664 TaxID=1463842 RepID=UPI00131D2BCD